MEGFVDSDLPAGFDWREWVERWDRMQNRYLVRRVERFALIVRMVRETRESLSRLLNIGCGPGSLMVSLLESFPEAEVFGVDSEPLMLLLARERLAEFNDRSRLVLADLREPSWSESLPVPVDAVVSATALHWLSPEALAALYGQLAQILRPGGIFLNADHAGSDYAPIQTAWERHRDEMRREEGITGAEDWYGFWEAYARALDVDIQRIRQRFAAAWEGAPEEGLPLAWHLDQLRANGFTAVDCFWRCDCDAVYGGIRR